MIQRIQTLFLLFVLGIAISIFFVPFQVIHQDTAAYTLCLMPGCSPEVMSSSIYAPMIINSIVAVLALVTIFLYKNRRLQIRLSNTLAMLNVFITGLFFLLSYVKPEFANATVNYGIGSFLPIVSIFAAFLASYYIRKDERLVRSADRIR